MSKQLLSEIEKTAADLAETNRLYDEAQKNALSFEQQARHIRTVIMPELKSRRAELNSALVHQQTITRVNDAVAVAQENAAKAEEARKNQEAATASVEKLREELQAELAQLREERKARDEAATKDDGKSA